MHGKERFSTIQQDSGNKQNVMNIYSGKLHAGDMIYIIYDNCGNEIGLLRKQNEHLEIQCLGLQMNQPEI